MASKRKHNKTSQGDNSKKRKVGRITNLSSFLDSSSDEIEDFANKHLGESSQGALSNNSDSLLPSGGKSNGKPKASNHFDSDTEEESEEEKDSFKDVPVKLQHNGKLSKGNKSSAGNGSSYIKTQGNSMCNDDQADETYDVFAESSDDNEENTVELYKKMKPEKREKILKFFQKSSEEELCHLSRCSAKKAKLLLELKPFTSYKNLLDKLDGSKLLNRLLIGSCLDLLKERNVLCNLMKKCLALSDRFNGEFTNVSKNNKFIRTQPKNIPDRFNLKEYQMIGMNWISLLHRHKVNGVLADEMGLGKTIQTIAFLAHLLDAKISSGPHIIIVPSSTLDNWQREFAVWCPDMKLISYSGNQRERRQVRHDILSGELRGNVILTTYNLATSQPEDRNLFRKLNTYFAVFDEGHMLKNMSSQRYQHLMRLNAKHRLLLTGTPLQNNLLELMSLLKFVMPHMFDESTSTLVKMFSSSSDSASPFAQQRIAQARNIMQPFVLRRLKADVLRQLPEKVDTVERCPLTEHQLAIYSKVQLIFQNKSCGKKLPASQLKNVCMELRKVANHPLLRRERFTDDQLIKMARLLKKSTQFCESNEKFLFEDMEVMTDFELNRLCIDNKCINRYKLEDSVLTESGKFKILDQLLPAFKAQGKRVLLFTQFTMVLDIVEVYLKLRNTKYLRLDGSTPVSERLDLIDNFNSDESYSVFILSTKAGGLGINLTSASVVIIHDIDWNPYNDKQAEDRCHRLGQTKTVEVIRLIGKNTIEEAMHKNALKKLKLEKEMTENDEDDMDIVALISENILNC